MEDRKPIVSVQKMDREKIARVADMIFKLFGEENLSPYEAFVTLSSIHEFMTKELKIEYVGGF
jgi:hypothetical protein